MPTVVTTPSKDFLKEPVPVRMHRDPVYLPYDKFCDKWFALLSQTGINLIRNFAPGEDGLAGMCMKAYESYRIAIRVGWEKYGE